MDGCGNFTALGIEHNRGKAVSIRKFATIAVIFAFAFAGVAHGQIEDIVVTAEKREANLQDTSIAIAAFSGDSLRDLQLEEIQDVILRTPSMAFSRAGGEGQIYIRGIGSNLLGIGKIQVSPFIKMASISAGPI